MAIAQTVARRHVMPWLDTEETQAEKLYDEITQRFVNLVNDLLRRISEAQAADFSHLPKSSGSRTRLPYTVAFFFHDMITIAQPASPLLYLIDCVTGALQIRRWVEKDAANFLEHLLETNAARFRATWNNASWRAACVLNPTSAGCCVR